MRRLLHLTAGCGEDGAMERTTAAVLLAAGAGSRLGRGPKALLPFRGWPLIEHQIRVLRDGGCSEVYAVLGAGFADILAGARLDGARTVHNAQWRQGMGGSYRLGITAALGATETPGSVLVALVDQPGLSPAVVGRILAAGTPGRIAAAAYRDGPKAPLRRGHPVLFDAGLARRSLEPDARATSAAGDRSGDPAAARDAGARAFLAAHPGLVDLIDCSDLADGRDVDTETDIVLLD